MNFVILTQEVIRPEEMLKNFSPLPSCGARIWFEGIVRNENKGRPVRGIFYEAYEAMAKKELRTILKQAKAKWPVKQIGIVHRLGCVAVGETALFVLVSSPHRREAFAAVQFVVERLKQKVPIWKKEFYEEDGRHSNRWTEPSVWQG